MFWIGIVVGFVFGFLSGRFLRPKQKQGSLSVAVPEASPVESSFVADPTPVDTANILPLKKHKAKKPKRAKP